MLTNLIHHGAASATPSHSQRPPSATDLLTLPDAPPPYHPARPSSSDLPFLLLACVKIRLNHFARRVPENAHVHPWLDGREGAGTPETLVDASGFCASLGAMWWQRCGGNHARRHARRFRWPPEIWKGAVQEGR